MLAKRATRCSPNSASVSTHLNVLIATGRTVTLGVINVNRDYRDCFQSRQRANLVTMTRKQSARAGTSSQSPRGQWRLQDAKARFSELVRLAHSEGPQRVTLHGRDAVVVVDAEEFLRLKGGRTGQLLIDALQASPHRDIEIEPRRSATPVRDVSL
jgi:prevent-host-death family protein